MWKGALRHALRTVLYGALFVALAGTAAYLWYLESRPELSPWHTEDLESEFCAEDVEAGRVTNFVGYQILEAELFRELHDKVYDAVPAEQRGKLDRFVTGSLTDPEGMVPNWNRSIERTHPAPRAAVLLLHGLTDAPYSVRALAERLASRGAWVVALRVPGHGTAPVGLTTVTWQSFAAATRLAADHLAEQVGDDVPLFLVGYSNGAALAVHYALRARDDDGMRAPAGLVLLAPAIGITRAAALAVWQARLGTLLGLDKVAWNSILPEFDPYKYNSFPVNGGDQMFLLTRELRRLMDRAAGGGLVSGFPRTLVFHSAVDATVISEAIVSRLLGRLAPGGHELVLFDLNRRERLSHFVHPAAGRFRDRLLGAPTPSFAFTLVTNASPGQLDVVARRREAGGEAFEETPLDLRWPEGIYSMSHVAIPFRPDDPWYGFDAPSETAVALGRLAPRGERGVLIVPPADALRLRSNPFYPYLEERVGDFVFGAARQASR